MKNPICPYCGNTSELVGGQVIYPHRPDLKRRRFYLCRPCKAYVGTHKGKGHRPLGRLANAELRNWKMRAHDAFDPMWRGGGIDRREAYQWLADQMGIEVDECHIGMFDVERCSQVVRLCEGAQ